MNNLYYTAPTDEIFEEIKEGAIEIWNTYDDTHGYASEKIDKIKDMGNISDNAMYIVAMFDINNQGKLSAILSEEARKEISDRIIAGGGGLYNVFE